MSDTPNRHQPEDDETSGARAPYRKPTLTVYGPVASMTHAASMSGSTKDGGPNNVKS